MSPELEYFKQFSIWKRLAYFVTGVRSKPKNFYTSLRCRFSVEYTTEKFVRHSGSVRDFSETGIRFAVEAPPKAGKIIELRLVLPEEFGSASFIIVKSRVLKAVRPPGRRRFRVGCEFISASPEYRAKLNEFLEWNSQVESEAAAAA